ncbi:hypothetical protein BVZ79_01027 [Haemophilus influenzae]|nr:hypothetical protein BVZ79_01027 [Haemophilus influenzae]
MPINVGIKKYSFPIISKKTNAMPKPNRELSWDFSFNQFSAKITKNSAVIENSTPFKLKGKTVPNKFPIAAPSTQ